MFTAGLRPSPTLSFYRPVVEKFLDGWIAKGTLINAVDYPSPANTFGSVYRRAVHARLFCGRACGAYFIDIRTSVTHITWRFSGCHREPPSFARDTRPRIFPRASIFRPSSVPDFSVACISSQASTTSHAASRIRTSIQPTACAPFRCPTGRQQVGFGHLGLGRFRRPRVLTASHLC